MIVCSLYFKFSSALCNIPFALMGYDTQSKCALSSYNKSFANAECSEKDKDIKSNQFTRRDSSLINKNTPPDLPSYDAASPPHESNTAIIQCPIKLFGCLPHQHEALSIGHNLRCIQSLFNGFK